MPGYAEQVARMEKARRAVKERILEGEVQDWMRLATDPALPFMCRAAKSSVFTRSPFGHRGRQLRFQSVSGQ
jgi:hypothetical protein